MKILAPVTSVKEGKLLIAQGADELYCGMGLDALRKKGEESRREVWINRRETGKANLSDLETLNRLTGLAHAHGKKVYLALNQPGYSKELQGELVSAVQDISQTCQVDAFIVADPGLIRLLIEKIPEIVIHVSSLAAVLNSSSIVFFKKLGVKRIIFPRYIDTKTLKTTIEAGGPDLEYEVFALNDGCVFEESFCHVSHAFGGAFCHNPAWQYKLLPHEDLGNPTGKKVKGMKISGESFRQHIDEYKRWQWIGIKNCGGLLGPKYPLGMCGLCALPDYEAMGITSLKIVGREAPLRKKVESVKLLKTVLTYQSEGHTPNEIRHYAKTVKGFRALCDSGYMCYDR